MTKKPAAKIEVQVREYEISSCSVVFLGNFNPKIFSPAWLEKCGLITDEEAASAETVLIHPEVSQFSAGGISLQVEQLRFVASGTKSPIRLRDLVVRTFKDFLSHTPIRALGINRDAHYRLKAIEDRIRLGRSLAPLAPWGEWGVRMEKPGSPDLTSGMVSLTMREIKKQGRFKGHLQANVQPSNYIPRNLGVFFQTNDHIELDDPESEATDELLDYLDAEFENSIKQSDWIIDQVLATADL